MTNENRDNLKFQSPLTVQGLKMLKDKGYNFLQVQGFTIDHHAEYVEPHYMMLVPVKELPVDQDKKGIYEPIDSTLLYEWAIEKDSHLAVILATNKQGVL